MLSDAVEYRLWWIVSRLSVCYLIRPSLQDSESIRIESSTHRSTVHPAAVISHLEDHVINTCSPRHVSPTYNYLTIRP